MGDLSYMEFGKIIITEETSSYASIPMKDLKNIQITTYVVDPLTHIPLDSPTETRDLRITIEEFDNLLDAIATRKALAESDEIIPFEVISKELSLDNLGWTKLETIDVRNRLTSFEEDWDAPGMELYDEL